MFNRYFTETLKTRYADFTGRATRSEYWYFILFSFLLSFAFSVIDTFVINRMIGMDSSQSGGILGVLFSLALIIPSIAIGVRRLHDTGKSGLWLLIGFLPVIGTLILLFFFVQKSK